MLRSQETLKLDPESSETYIQYFKIVFTVGLGVKSFQACYDKKN